MKQNDQIVGNKFKIVKCEALNHGADKNCVCGLIGSTVLVMEEIRNPFGRPSVYKIHGSDKVIDSREITPYKKPPQRTIIG